MKNKNSCPDAGKGERKLKMAVPTWGGDFENQNMSQLEKVPFFETDFRGTFVLR